MSRFFSSDMHLNSTNINEYAKRAFTSAENAAHAMVYNINDTCTRTDLLIHAGDFILTSVDRHGKVADLPLDVSVETYLSKINCRLFLVAGNHDDAHSIEADANNLCVNLNHRWKNVYVNHFPSTNPDYNGPTGSKYKIKINLCGHVHNKWLLYYDKDARVLNYNVGVDVHNFKPVRDSEITEALDFLFMHGFDKNESFGLKSFSWTPKDFEYWKLTVAHDLKVERMERKAKRYEKKGLTPEICAQRRAEAIKAKALMLSKDKQFKR